MLPIKWRLLIGACILSVVSIALRIAKGEFPLFPILLAVGIVLLIVSLIWLWRTRRG